VNVMKKRFANLLAVCVLTTNMVLYSQDGPPREYIPETELVSLNSDLDFSMALDLLSEYAIQHARKPIYDPEKRVGAIGVDIRTMPWKKALEVILSRRGLWFSEKEHFFEIVVPDSKGGDFAGSVAKMDDGTEMRLGGREVKIEAIFFEGDRSTLREIGIDWSTFYQGDLDISAEQVGALQLSDYIATLDVKIPSKLYGIGVDVLLRIFDSMSIGQVVAQPQITVMEGKDGKIQVGQDFSIKTKDFAGNVLDRFFSTGTILNVTPYVLEDEKKRPVIVLDVHVERSQAYPDAVSTIVKKSEANSCVQLFDGEETLIAGLYSTETTNIRKGIPFLKDLPWWFLGLRYIFGYDRDEDAQKELVIIIKASLLPEVFARLEDSKTNPSRQNESGDPKLRIRQLTGNRLSNNGQQFNNEEKGKKPLSAPVEVKPKDENTEESAKVRGYSEPAPVAGATQSTLPARELYRGIIKKMQNNLALIEWERNFNGENVVGELLTVLRKNGSDSSYRPIGKVKILKAQESLTVGKKAVEGSDNLTDLHIGDLVVANY
jgi:general secretion pathway protein D